MFNFTLFFIDPMIKPNGADQVVFISTIIVRASQSLDSSIRCIINTVIRPTAIDNRIGAHLIKLTQITDIQ